MQLFQFCLIFLVFFFPLFVSFCPFYLFWYSRPSVSYNVFRTRSVATIDSLIAWPFKLDIIYTDFLAWIISCHQSVCVCGMCRLILLAWFHPRPLFPLSRYRRETSQQAKQEPTFNDVAARRRRNRTYL